MKRKGFTLIELLAVIVILAIILAIAIPSVTGIISKATRNAFASDIKLVIKAISYQKLNNENFDVTTINEDTVVTTLGLSNANYESVDVTVENNEAYIVVVGKNKWAGLTGYGTFKNITIVNSADYDVTPPVITLLGDNPVNIKEGNVYSDAGATANDNHDGNITDAIVVTGEVNTNVRGTYIITYNVSDAAGNEADPVTRTVNVIDGTSPVITLLGTSSVTITVGDVYSDVGATALDDTEGDITANITVTSTVNPNAVGSYTVTYNVSDSVGNEAVPVIRTVIVEAVINAQILTTFNIMGSNGDGCCGGSWYDGTSSGSSPTKPISNVIYKYSVDGSSVQTGTSIPANVKWATLEGFNIMGSYGDGCCGGSWFDGTSAGSSPTKPISNVTYRYSTDGTTVKTGGSIPANAKWATISNFNIMGSNGDGCCGGSWYDGTSAGSSPTKPISNITYIYSVNGTSVQTGTSIPVNARWVTLYSFNIMGSYGDGCCGGSWFDGTSSGSSPTKPVSNKSYSTYRIN